MPLIPFMALAANIIEYVFDKVRMLRIARKPRRTNNTFQNILVLFFFIVSVANLVAFPNGGIWILSGKAVLEQSNCPIYSWEIKRKKKWRNREINTFKKKMHDTAYSLACTLGAWWCVRVGRHRRRSTRFTHLTSWQVHGVVKSTNRAWPPVIRTFIRRICLLAGLLLIVEDGVR